MHLNHSCIWYVFPVEIQWLYILKKMNYYSFNCIFNSYDTIHDNRKVWVPDDLSYIVMQSVLTSLRSKSERNNLMSFKLRNALSRTMVLHKIFSKVGANVRCPSILSSRSFQLDHMGYEVLPATEVINQNVDSWLEVLNLQNMKNPQWNNTHTFLIQILSFSWILDLVTVLTNTGCLLKAPIYKINDTQIQLTQLAE